MVKPFFQFCSSSLLALLSLGIANVSAIAQPTLTDQVATESISITLQADQVHNYNRLIEQAVVMANDAIATSFDTNPEAAPIELTVLINRNGQLLPLLMAEVSREQWQQQSDIQTWARYSTSVRILLGYAQPTQIAASRQQTRQQFLAELNRREALIDELD